MIGTRFSSVDNRTDIGMGCVLELVHTDAVSAVLVRVFYYLL